MAKIFRVANDQVIVGLLEIKNGREAEQEGEQKLLEKILGRSIPIKHNSDGKPLIDGYNISISHTLGYVTIILSKNYKVGIDIEYPSERVKRISSRFVREDEIFTSLSDLLTMWCVKESMYKLFSSKHLSLKEIKVNLVSHVACNLRDNIKIPFHYSSTDNYVLTYLWY